MASTACSLFQPTIDEAFARRLGSAVLDSEDPDTVIAGLPAYVILIDAMLVDAPADPAPWLAGAQLNSVLGSIVAADDAERFRVLAAKALRYAEAGAARQNEKLGGLREVTFAELDARLAAARGEDVSALLALGSAWAAHIRAAGEDVEAIGDIPRVRSVLERVVALDPSSANGVAHLYLGAFASMVSEEQGGDLAPARAHFQRALDLAGGNDLSAKTALALLAAQRGDIAERDRILREVVAADPRGAGRTLLNVLAQRRARAILAGENDPWSPF
jgi:tetratricopeptide (TPR) repeat protein